MIIYGLRRCMKMSGYNGSQLWDAAFATRAILESDLGKLFPETIAKSYQFIDLSQIDAEHRRYGRVFPSSHDRQLAFFNG